MSSMLLAGHTTTGSAPLAVFIYNTPYTMPFGAGKGGFIKIQQYVAAENYIYLRQRRPRQQVRLPESRQLADEGLDVVAIFNSVKIPRPKNKIRLPERPGAVYRGSRGCDGMVVDVRAD